MYLCFFMMEYSGFSPQTRPASIEKISGRKKIPVVCVGRNHVVTPTVNQ